jgi:hypothetical protein
LAGVGAGARVGDERRVRQRREQRAGLTAAHGVSWPVLSATLFFLVARDSAFARKIAPLRPYGLTAAHCVRPVLFQHTLFCYCCCFCPLRTRPYSRIYANQFCHTAFPYGLTAAHCVSWLVLFRRTLLCCGCWRFSFCTRDYPVPHPSIYTPYAN